MRTFHNCSDRMHNIDLEKLTADLQMENSKKRQSKQRLMTVVDDYGKKHEIMKENNYDLATGEVSVFQRELKGNEEFRVNAKDTKRHLQVAGRDYENEELCLRCWIGGDLMLCDRCPAAYHELCLDSEQLSSKLAMYWMCPHHSCTVCKRTAGAVGGLLFRCSECPTAYCEDHLPVDAAINGRCHRMELGGFVHPTQACYIHCSDACAAYAASYADTVAHKTNKRLYNTDAGYNSNNVSGAASSSTAAAAAAGSGNGTGTKITMKDLNTDSLSFLSTNNSSNGGSNGKKKSPGKGSSPVPKN